MARPGPLRRRLTPVPADMSVVPPLPARALRPPGGAPGPGAHSHCAASRSAAGVTPAPRTVKPTALTPRPAASSSRSL